MMDSLPVITKSVNNWYLWESMYNIAQLQAGIPYGDSPPQIPLFYHMTWSHRSD